MFNFEKLDVWQKAIDFADLGLQSHPKFPLRRAVRFNKPNAARRCIGLLEYRRGNIAGVADRFWAIYRNRNGVSL